MGNEFWERNKGYGITIDEYRGNFSLIAARQKEDKVYKDWVYISEWDENSRGFVPSEKKRPMGVYLGDRETAVAALRFFLKNLSGNAEEHQGNDEAPF